MNKLEDFKPFSLCGWWRRLLPDTFPTYVEVVKRKMMGLISVFHPKPFITPCTNLGKERLLRIMYASVSRLTMCVRCERGRQSMRAIGDNEALGGGRLKSNCRWVSYETSMQTMCMCVQNISVLPFLCANFLLGAKLICVYGLRLTNMVSNPFPTMWCQ